MASARLVLLLGVLAGCGSQPDYTMGDVAVWDDVGVSQDLVRRALVALADEGSRRDPALAGAHVLPAELHVRADRTGCDGGAAEGCFFRDERSIWVEVHDPRCLAWSALADEYSHLLAQAAGRPPGHGPEYFADGGCRPEGGWAVCLAVRLLRDACDDRDDGRDR